MMFDPELDVALNGLRKKCWLEGRSFVNCNGKIEACYDVVRPGRFGNRKIAEVKVTNKKVKIGNFTESMYDFQKDELMSRAVEDVQKVLRET